MTTAASMPRILLVDDSPVMRKAATKMLSDEFDAYWLAGLQVQWAPWTWGRTRREREVLRHTFHEVEFISLHTYLNDYAKDTPAFIANSRPALSPCSS